MFGHLVFLLALSGGYAYMTDAEVKASFTKTVLQCNSQHPVPLSELVALQNLKTPTNRNTKCLLACAYKTEGSINLEGKYDLAQAYRTAEYLQSGSSERIEKAMRLADACAKVNDEVVTDGSQGCDVAALLFECVIQNAPLFGFMV